VDFALFTLAVTSAWSVYYDNVVMTVHR
jgi:hypothetical protein